MAITAQKSVASLMQRSIDRRASLGRMKFKLKENQVRKILHTYLDNNVAPYNDLIEILNLCPLSDGNFKVLFEDCIACVVLLDRDFKPFVSVLCDVEWTNKSDENVALFSTFLLDLVTTHTYHSPLVMASLVKLFRGKLSDCLYQKYLLLVWMFSAIKIEKIGQPVYDIWHCSQLSRLREGIIKTAGKYLWVG